MKLVFQRSLCSSTQLVDSGLLLVEAMLLTSATEMTARMTVAKDSFQIQTATWERLREGDDFSPCGMPVPLLQGTEAYFGAAPALARAFPHPDQETQRELFAECVKAVLQSETYIYRDRGFSDAESYQRQWELEHPNSCRYYSHLDLVKQRWFDHIGPAVREKVLFQRQKKVSVWQSETGQIQMTGAFLDSFHELGCLLQAEANGEIRSVSAGFLRAPDSICFGTSALTDYLVGKNFRELTRRDLNRSLGGAEGCVHLLDLGREMLTELKNFEKHLTL